MGYVAALCVLSGLGGSVVTVTRTPPPRRYLLSAEG
jgi:hypothetical protein